MTIKITGGPRDEQMEVKCESYELVNGFIKFISVAKNKDVLLPAGKITLIEILHEDNNKKR